LPQESVNECPRIASASQVSRDERNEYHGITVERASKVLHGLGVDCRSMFEIE